MQAGCFLFPIVPVRMNAIYAETPPSRSPRCRPHHNPRYLDRTSCTITDLLKSTDSHLDGGTCFLI